jgi:hypothetical protein
MAFYLVAAGGRHERPATQAEVNEYRLAVQTNDNTQGALNEARQWLQKPYTRPPDQ